MAGGGCQVSPTRNPKLETRNSSTPGMKKFLRWVVGGLAVLVVLLVGVLLARNPILKAITKQGIEESTGLRVEIGELESAFGSASIHIRDLRLYNPMEYGGALMASAPEVLLDIDAEQAAEGRLHFRNLKLNLTELNVVKNLKGRFNLEGVEKKIRERLERRKRKKNQDFEFEYGGIEHMELTLGTVSFTDMARPKRSRSFDLGVKDEVVSDLKTEDDLQRWIGAMLFRILMQGTFTKQPGTDTAELASPSDSTTNAPTANP